MLILWFHIRYVSIASSQRPRFRHVKMQISGTSGKIFAYSGATGSEFIGNAVGSVSPDNYINTG